jgi:hypothetical protein
MLAQVMVLTKPIHIICLIVSPTIWQELVGLKTKCEPQYHNKVLTDLRCPIEVF